MAVNYNGAIRKLNQFLSLLEGGHHSDLNMQVKNETFKLHKCILSIVSPEMLSKVTNSRNGTYDYDPIVFKAYLRRIYGAEDIELCTENVYVLCKISSDFSDQELYDECLEFISNSLAIDNFFEIASHIKVLDHPTLLTKFEDFYKSNAIEITQHVGFRSFLHSQDDLAIHVLQKAATNQRPRRNI